MRSWHDCAQPVHTRFHYFVWVQVCSRRFAFLDRFVVLGILVFRVILACIAFLSRLPLLPTLVPRAVVAFLVAIAFLPIMSIVACRALFGFLRVSPVLHFPRSLYV